MARLALEHNYLLRVRGTKIVEKFEDDREGLEMIRELGQQIISGDQYLEEAWDEILKDCTEFDDLNGKTCPFGENFLAVQMIRQRENSSIFPWWQ